MNQSQLSEYNQESFSGGMNLLLDDTHLKTNQYRVGFNIRNRYDKLDLVLSSSKDTEAPYGKKQEMTTFGNYEILFVAGKAYYKLFTDITWAEIANFQMSSIAPRLWTKAVPLATTNYIRFAPTSEVSLSSSTTIGSGSEITNTSLYANSRGQIISNSVAGAARGNMPGLLVQDNVNQPWFIFIASDGLPYARETQNFNEWGITFTDADNVTIAENGDNREYVPIGNVMEYVDGILYIASQDGQYIYRSVSGRPLDFVVNVTNKLVDESTVPKYTQRGGGDAMTTAYSVGVGPITALKAMSDGSLFVAAGNANFSVAKNLSNLAPMEFGEYTFLRTFLFNAVCLSERAIFDTLGDTRFITLGGVRSFNAISQTQNEGRNTPFTNTIQKAFSGIIQNPSYAAAILYDDYELYAVETIFGPVIAVYDTINGCWVGFDTNQTDGNRIKQFAKIELTSQALYAITDKEIYRLYVGPSTDTAFVRLNGICSNLTVSDDQTKVPSPKWEVKLANARVILNNITEDCTCELTAYVNNRVSSVGTLLKNITYKAPEIETDNLLALDDVDTQLENLFFNLPGCEQGWKTFCTLSWNNGSITQFNAEFVSLTPRNPLNSQ